MQYLVQESDLRRIVLFLKERIFFVASKIGVCDVTGWA